MLQGYLLFLVSAFRALHVFAAQAIGEANSNPGFLGESLNALQAKAQPVEAPSLFATLVNVVISLGFVVLLIYLVLWVIKRWMTQRGGSRAALPEERLIRVLDRHYLDSKRGLALVDMGGKLLLLGLGENISLLGEVSDAKKAEEIRQSAGSQTFFQNFPQQFDKIGSLLRKNQWQKNRQALKNQTDALKKQIEKLKPLAQEEE